MANRYYGDFRSIDNSIDPKGQKYRVVIFTGYNGSIPYEYETITRPNHQMIELIGYLPIKNYQITMTDNPFTVSYQGDNENIYKPYRCSTATVSFLQSNINLDFLNSNGTSTLVMLLKWKNEVAEVNGRMYNSVTGATLNKKLLMYNDFVLYNDYDPYKYDKFCYNVEWVGFSTPETFSMDYSHNNDTFTLNCQDALSTLQFIKYDRPSDANQLQTVKDEFFYILQRIATYKKIYVTDTVKLPSVTDITGAISTQTLNNFDEDKKAVDYLTVFTRLLTYLNLTAIPYKDNLIITTPNAITEGWNNYNVYALPQTDYIMNYPSQTPTYTAAATEYLADNYTITADSYADGGTTISTVNIYNSITAEVDNYEVGDLMPEIDNTDTFIADPTMLTNYYSETVTEGQETVTNYYTWERKNVTPPANGNITLKHYNTDAFGGVWNTELNYMPTLTEYSKPGCYLIEHSGMQQTPSANELPLNSNYGRDFYFHTARFINGSVYLTRRDAGINNNPPSMDDKSQRWQPMLIFDSDNVLMFSGDHLNLCGEWTFYAAKDYDVYLAPYSFSHKTTQSKAHTGSLNTLYNYVWGKVRVGNRWLSNEGDNYKWNVNETWVRLIIDWQEGKLAFSTPYTFKQTHRNITGTCIPLPITGNNVMFGNIHIELDRPLGTYYYACSSALLKDFEVKVITVDGTHNRNIEFKTEINTDNVTEYSVDTNIGSQHTNGALWSEAVKGANPYYKMGNVYNVATGNYYLPEQHITTNIANQYATPTINLQMTLHNDLTPYSLITWSKLNGKRFMVDAMEIDFELERATVGLAQVKAPANLQTTRRNATRNYRRNADIIANPQTTYDNKITLTGETMDWSNFGGFSDNNGFLRCGTYNDAETIAANITIQPNYTNGTMQISIPNDLDGDITATANGDRLQITDLR